MLQCNFCSCCSFCSFAELNVWIFNKFWKNLSIFPKFFSVKMKTSWQNFQWRFHLWKLHDSQYTFHFVLKYIFQGQMHVISLNSPKKNVFQIFNEVIIFHNFMTMNWIFFFFFFKKKKKSIDQYKCD